MYIHADLKPLVCEECGKAFRYPSALSTYCPPPPSDLLLTDTSYASKSALGREAAAMHNLREKLQRVIQPLQTQADSRGPRPLLVRRARLRSQLSPARSAPPAHEDAPERGWYRADGDAGQSVGECL